MRYQHRLARTLREPPRLTLHMGLLQDVQAALDENKLRAIGTSVSQMRDARASRPRAARFWTLCARWVDFLYPWRALVGVSDTLGIVDATELRSEHLELMKANRVAAVVIRQVLTHSQCDALCAACRHDQVVPHEHFWPLCDHSLTRSDARVLGYVANDFLRSAVEYDESAVESMARANTQIQSDVNGQLTFPNPVENFQRRLIELHGHRAIEGHLWGVLDPLRWVVRYYRAEDVPTAGFVHTDASPFMPAVAGKCQFGVNAYLRMPEQGGELFVYPFGFHGVIGRVAGWISAFMTWPKRFIAHTCPMPWDLHEQRGRFDRLRLTPVTIRPRKGDIVLVNQSCFHAVNGFVGSGERITMQFFTEVSATSLRVFV